MDRLFHDYGFEGGGFARRNFFHDHEPAHVHVFGDGDAKINLTGDKGPHFVWINRMNRGEARRAMELVTTNREHLLARWREIHG